MTTTRLVTVGDSFTEGMCDDLRADGHHVGWADRTAAALAAGASDDGVEYANLAVRGKLLDGVVAEQVPVAMALGPTVITFHAGPNDVLRRGTDLPDLFRRYDDAVARVGADGATVVLFTSIGRAGGSGRVATLLAERFGRFNDNVRATAARRGALVVDLERVDVLTDRRLWHTDRLHLNADGHRRVAAATLEVLGVDDPELLGGEPGWWRLPLPPRPPTSRRADLAGDATWVREHLLPWVGRRLRGVSSGDGREPKDTVLRHVAAADAAVSRADGRGLDA
jgi:lysophospholipase L1-like esterase